MKSNKGEGGIGLIIFTFIMLFVIIWVCSLGYNKETTVQTVAPAQNYESTISQTPIPQCEHDWVVTSKYDWIFKSYKTYSKCSKCSKEI